MGALIEPRASAQYRFQGGFEFAMEPSNTPGTVRVWRRGSGMEWGKPSLMLDIEARDRYGFEPKRDSSG